MPRRNTTSIQDSELEIRDYLMWFYYIPLEYSWHELKDYVRDEMGCKSVTYAEIIHEEASGRSMGQGWVTVKIREEAINGYYNIYLRQREINPGLITLWEGRIHNPTNVVSEIVPFFPGQGRAAGIRYRLFTLKGQSKVKSSSAANAGLLLAYESDVIGSILTVVPAQITDERRREIWGKCWRLSEQVYQHFVNDWRREEETAQHPQPRIWPQINQTSVEHREYKEHQAIQNYNLCKAVEAKNYQNLYTVKLSPHAFPPLHSNQTYGAPSGPSGTSPVKFVNSLAAWSEQTNLVTHGWPSIPVLGSPSSPARDPCAYYPSPFPSHLINGVQAAHSAEPFCVSIKNLPVEATSSNILSMFSSTGLRCVEVAVLLPGRAVARFATREEASRAVQRYDGKDFLGRPIDVREDNHPIALSEPSMPNATSIPRHPKDEPPIIVDGSGASGARFKHSQDRSPSVISAKSGPPENGHGSSISGQSERASGEIGKSRS
ncbi:MAG: hypothetical protein M1835_001392 [Candelina submexicana]|nr:MAG: hypothetical protein M1835_001392 [Candelina submexicana]